MNNYKTADERDKCMNCANCQYNENYDEHVTLPESSPLACSLTNKEVEEEGICDLFKEE